jgi:hypothetical protein
MPSNETTPLDSDNLIDLYKHFESSIANELGFVFQYFNFYIGLLSAIAAATLTGILSLNTTQHTSNRWDLILISGPVAILLLSLLGYQSIKVYYHRFTEAWVTKINIESMLSLQANKNLEKSIGKPLYPSENGGFITQVDNPKLKEVFDKALKESWNAEQLSTKLVEVGITLTHAKWTFICFCLLGIGLAVVNFLIVLHGG